METWGPPSVGICWNLLLADCMVNCGLCDPFGQPTCDMAMEHIHGFPNTYDSSTSISV